MNFHNKTGSIVCTFADEEMKREKLGILETTIRGQELGTTAFLQHSASGTQSVLLCQRRGLKHYVFKRNTCKCITYCQEAKPCVWVNWKCACICSPYIGRGGTENDFTIPQKIGCGGSKP